MILLDLMMPEMDGFEVLDALAAHGEWRDIPVIVITAKQLSAAERERLLGQAQKVFAKGTAVGLILRQPSARRFGVDPARRSRREYVRQKDEPRANGEILLVEDNEMNRDMLSRRLTRRGFEVIFAVDGQQGVDLARTQRPDIILMDMSLPVLDGWEATRLVKADDATRSVPVIGLTAHAMSGDRERAIEAGCDDYDTKPVELTASLARSSGFLVRQRVNGRRSKEHGGTATTVRIR